MICRTDPATLRQIQALVAPILSEPNRREKLAKLGFTIRRIGTKPVLATLPHGLTVCDIP